jgi:hypothetical protein
VCLRPPMRTYRSARRPMRPVVDGHSPRFGRPKSSARDTSDSGPIYARQHGNPAGTCEDRAPRRRQRRSRRQRLRPAANRAARSSTPGAPVPCQNTGQRPHDTVRSRLSFLRFFRTGPETSAGLSSVGCVWWSRRRQPWPCREWTADPVLRAANGGQADHSPSATKRRVTGSDGW